MATMTAYPSDELHRVMAEGRCGHIINGQLEAVAGRDLHPVLDPATGEQVLEIPLGTGADVDRAVASARHALSDWRRRPPVARAAVLLGLADLIDEHAEILAQLESLDVGKSLTMSRDEMPVAADQFRFMAGAIRTAQTPAADEYAAGYLSMIRREPLGVVAAITPWNYPLMTATWKIAPALAAGNTVVLKPSELTPLSTAFFVDRAQALLPPGVLNLVLGTGPGVGQALADHPHVDAISLTGSIDAGVTVARSSAATLKRVHLELGGKAPVVVFDDADLDAVATSVRGAGFWNAGQECGAATRVLCAAGVEHELVAKLAGAASSLKRGRPHDGDDIEIGPLISSGHLERVDEMVRQAVDAGATAATGGHPAEDGGGFFYEPTVLTGVQEGSKISRSEIFGPVVTVETFTTEEEAIRRANDSGYGLAASVWTESTRLALRMTEALDYGTVWVNVHLVAATEMPWGGFGMSGVGRECSTYAIDDFSRTKHVMIAK